MASMYCDNYRTCNNWVPDLGTQTATESRARARGWHIFHGETQGGAKHDGVLCDRCVGTSRSRPVIPPPVEGEQLTLNIQ